LIKPFGGRVKNADLSNLTEVRSIIREFDPDSVIHLAAQPGVRLKPQQYERYSKDNLLAFSNLLQVVTELKMKNFIYASSSSVYGNSAQSVLKEDSEDLSPVSYYGGTKLANEILAKSCGSNPDFSSIGLRFFTVYGPYGRPDMAYFRLLSQALTPYGFELYGDGSVKRDFTFIGDTVEAVYRLIVRQSANQFLGSQIFNVGGGNPASMLEMISEVEKLTGKQLNYRQSKAHSGDVRSTNANTEKLKAAIGFVPHTVLEQGLANTFEWASRPGVTKKLEEWAKSVG
jgi:UDP-glucuronate 4-epimerase